LKVKYGVTSQHTFVLVDAQWNMIKKANWISTLDDITAFVK
jgi:hypothetical protein